MNKRDLIDAISGRLGDKKSATEALNAVLETIAAAVASGDKVAITGFGVFEKSERPGRLATPRPVTRSRWRHPQCRSSVPARTSRPSSTAAPTSLPKRRRLSRPGRGNPYSTGGGTGVRTPDAAARRLLLASTAKRDRFAARPVPVAATLLLRAWPAPWK